MFKSLLKYSIRALSRQKSYVIINIIGLAVGIACSLIIGLFIFHELSYDQYNKEKDRLYRVILNGKIGGQEVTVSSTASPIGPAMKNEFPEVEDFCRINDIAETNLRYKDRSFAETNYLQADSSFFKFFSIPLLRGQKETVLNEPHTLVLTEKVARKIFGDEDPIDKMLKVGTDSIPYRVTGIMSEVPEASHFSANVIGSFVTNPRADDNQWLSNSFDTYVLLYPSSQPSSVDARFPAMIVKYVGPEVVKFFGITIEDFLAAGNKYRMFLQSLTKIHLDPSVQQDMKPANDPKYLYIFGSIGILILIIASVNFMNLSTAQSSRRAKEVGIKKVSGSGKELLILQFLLETIVLSFIALILAVIITEVFLPYFNELLDVKLQMNYFHNWYTIPALILLSLLVGLFAGTYPAFYLSSFNPYQVLKGERVKGKGNAKLRNVLVILQFTISIMLIIGTLIMFRQISFMLNKNLGFNKDNVMVIQRVGPLGSHMKEFKNALLEIPGVLKVSASTAVPGRNNNNNGYRMKGRDTESFLLQTNYVDYDYLDTYGIELSSGRFFDPSLPTDRQACIINETAVKHYNLSEPFECRFVISSDQGDSVGYMPVIGIVNDFNFESLRSKIGPYMMRFRDDDVRWGYASIRLAPEASASTINQINNVWGSFTNNEPMQSFFMNKDFERLYKEEEQNAQLSILFTILGILIASMGLYGLTTFSIRQRTKEMGVRKTFGATVSNIWYLIAKEILILVSISTLIAIPVIYWIADNWLQNYQYRISLNILDFLAGFLIAIIIALITISYQALKTARANPSAALRYE